MERYIDIETSQTKHLESYIRPQWGWKTFTLISSFVAVLSFVVIDLEINFLKLLSDSTKYLGDILGRMLPPDFSNLKDLIYLLLLRKIKPYQILDVFKFLQYLTFFKGKNNILIWTFQ